jgi:hypothetical protein
MTRDEARDARKASNQSAGNPSPARPQPYTYRFASPGKEFRFELKFKRAEVTDEELIEVLEGILDQFRQIRQAPQDGLTPNTEPQPNQDETPIS